MKFYSKEELYGQVEGIRQQLYDTPPLTMPGYLMLLELKLPQVKVFRTKLDSHKLAAMLLRGDPGQGSSSAILLNLNWSEVSQRFSLTHELIHYFLHTNVDVFKCNFTNNTALEWQANEGAAELLVPYRSFLPSVANICSLLGQDRTAGIKQLAGRYQVSSTFIAHRLVSLAREIDLYLSGTPLDEIRPLSRGAQQRQGCARLPRFMEGLSPSLDVWADEGGA